MRKLALLTFVTLDGVMQAPSVAEEDTSGNFAHGGWARPWWDEVMVQVMREAMAQPYDLLLGRTTYDLFASAFVDVSEDNPVAARMNKAIKYVVTSRSANLDWQNSQQISGNIHSALQQIKAQEGPLLQVHGSWQLAQALLAHELVDELRLWTFPVVLGAGKRLFDGGSNRHRFSLVKSESTQGGAVMTIYRRESAGRTQLP